VFSTKCWSSFNVSRYIFFLASTNKLVAVTFDVIDGVQHFTTAVCIPSSRPLHFSVLVQSNRLSAFQFVQLLRPKLPFFPLILQFYIVYLFCYTIRPRSFRIVPPRNIKQKHTEVWRFIDDGLNKTDCSFGFVAGTSIALLVRPYTDTRVYILMCTTHLSR